MYAKSSLSFYSKTMLQIFIKFRLTGGQSTTLQNMKKWIQSFRLDFEKNSLV